MQLPKKFVYHSNARFIFYLSAFFIKAELRLQHQREQNREARQLRHKELEKNARDVSISHSYLSALHFLSNKNKTQKTI